MASTEIKIGKMWLSVGYSFRRLAFGFAVDRYHADIDFIFFWISWEF